MHARTGYGSRLETAPRLMGTRVNYQWFHAASSSRLRSRIATCRSARRNAAAVFSSNKAGNTSNTNATTVAGRVFDPAGQVPIYNANVYVPVNADVSQLTPISNSWADGVSCQLCSAATVHAVAVTQTDTNGAFTLQGVPSGSNIPLVVEMGKWRRIIVISTITACQSNTVTNNCTASDKSLCVVRLPRNRFDGYNPANGSYTYVSASGKLVLHKPTATFLSAAQSTLFPELNYTDAQLGSVFATVADGLEAFARQ